MVRTKRKSGGRKTVDCFLRCLNNKVYPHVLKWVNKERRIFSILFKNKKSPKWTVDYSSFFKELDSISTSKNEKYEKEVDSDQGSKRRCRANLRKLCEDKVFKFIKEDRIDKCTREKHYEISDLSTDEEFSSQTEDDAWISATLFSENNLENFTTGNAGPDVQHTLSAFQNDYVGNVSLTQAHICPVDLNNHNEDGCFDSFDHLAPLKHGVLYVDEFGQSYVLSTSYENVDGDHVSFYSALSNSSMNLDAVSSAEENWAFAHNSTWSNSSVTMDAAEPSQDINELMTLLNGKEEANVMLSNAPNISHKMDPSEVASYL